jgi:hypothetical protein
MVYRDIWKLRYHEHKWNAYNRGISFQLTFKEWCWLWKHSGKWTKRGWRKGQYVMSRPNDQGAYEVGNVIIRLAEENRAERNGNYPMKGKNNPAYGKDYWVSAPRKNREKRKQAISERLLGKPKSKKTRAAMSRNAKLRRWVWRNGRRAHSYPGDRDYPRP